MKTFVRIDGTRIVSRHELGSEELMLPLSFVKDTLGEDQVHGAAVIFIEDGKAVERIPAVRALSGQVCVLNAKGEIERVQGLGPDLVPVADNVYRFEEIRPPFDRATHIEDKYEDKIEGNKLTRRYKIRAFTKKEIAERSAEQQTRALKEKFGANGLQVALDQENRIRSLEKKAPLTEDQYREQVLASL